MKKTFQLSTVAIALATVSGGVIAAPSSVTGTATDSHYNTATYQRILGQSESSISTNGKKTVSDSSTVDNWTVVSKAADETGPTLVELELTSGDKKQYLVWDLADERRAGSTQTTIHNVDDTNISEAEEGAVASKVVQTRNITQLSGTAIHDGFVYQEIVRNADGKALDADGNVTTDLNKVQAVGDKIRGDDDAFNFKADNLNKVGGASKFVNNRTTIDTTYKPEQALDTTREVNREFVNETNAIAYGTNGKAKESGGTTDFIVTGVHKNVQTNKKKQNIQN